MTNQSPNIAALARTARPEVVSAIRQASARTGVDFAYLLEKAGIESSFDPRAQAGTSSARGLYQFIDSTWLVTLDRHGARHGYPNVAAAITRDGDGRPVVANAEAREYILALRDDPRVAALMAAEFARDNEQALEHSLGREVGKAELYMAHFLGAGGAAKFITEMEVNGKLEASSIVPAAAQANAGVFYERGEALSLDAVFARLAGKFHQDGNGAVATATMDTQERTGLSAPVSPAPTAAIIAAADPSFAALRADIATRLMTLSLLQAFDAGGDARPNEWIA